MKKTINMFKWYALANAITEKLQYFGKPINDLRLDKFNKLTIELAKTIKKNFVNKNIIVTTGAIGDLGGTEGYDYYKLKDVVIGSLKSIQKRPGYDYSMDDPEDMWDEDDKPPTPEEKKKAIEQLKKLKNIILMTNHGRVFCIPEKYADDSTADVVSRISIDES